MRAIIKGSCLVSVETAHFRGGGSEEACVRMLRVTMETGATAYISIHCMRLFHQGTFHHIINAQSVCSLLPKITTMSFQVVGSDAATVKVRLISLPIKPSLRMEQLSTAISKVTHEMTLLYFPKKQLTNTLQIAPDVVNVHFNDYQELHRLFHSVFMANEERRRVPWDVIGELEPLNGSDRKGNRMQRWESAWFIGPELFCQ